ncbi:MAG: ATP-dependent zinc metalloprotease FtsH, partial [Clostridia bacterium]|nr:ATP-dependent zinc metalloprotease FtsH [Clostridia bacterium]
TAVGARVPHGVLLVGPPGTGKTLFAKAVAGAPNVPFFSKSGSAFVEMFVGVGASRVRALFDQAKKNMPCIIFIDEIDAVGRQRGAGLGGGNDEREQTLNQLLVQMDGFEASSSIIVMAATNRADILDPALMRPGRFDRQVYVNVPDVKGREEIFKVHSRNKPLSSEINFKSLARLTSGFTGADIENILNEAAILAARENRKLIEMKEISEAINKVMAGPAKRSRLVTETDKRITAYHESGHAIVAKLMKHCDSVHEVSIIPRGMAAGYTITLPENDDNHMTKGKLLDNIAMMLAGRAAEEIVIKDVSTGASNDIQRASKIARRMVTEWGMSDTLGNMYLGGGEEVFLGRDYQTQLNYSDEVAAKIDAEVKRILDEQYKVALDILKANRSIMDAMVKALYEKETIYEDEIDALFGEDSSEKESLFSSKINRGDEPAFTAPTTFGTPTFGAPADNSENKSDNDDNNGEF